jgi:hypothetical protein
MEDKSLVNLIKWISFYTFHSVIKVNVHSLHDNWTSSFGNNLFTRAASNKWGNKLASNFLFLHPRTLIDHGTAIHAILFSFFFFIYLALPTRAGSPQQHMPITVGPFYLTHPVNFQGRWNNKKARAPL